MCRMLGGKSRLIDTENRLVVDSRGGGLGVDKMGQKLLTYNCKISHGGVMYSMVIIVYDTVLHI